jgi:dUTP pyrophosphatase
VIPVKRATQATCSSRPQRQSNGAAGYDLHADLAKAIRLAPGESRLVPTGWCIAIPDGFVGLIRDRSGAAVNRRLTTRAGVIDEDYRGEIMVVMVNESDEPQKIVPDERIAQIVIVPCLMTEMIEVDDLGETERNRSGFGSTGR